MSPPTPTMDSSDSNEPTDTQIEDEMCLLDLEDADSLLEHVEELISMNFEDFPEDQIDDDAARYAAKMTKASITDGTQTGHLRIIRHYFTYHLRRNKKWDPKQVDEQTPRDIATFITQKCGPIQDGFQGRKYSTAVSTRAALTMWYRSIRPNESLTEWRLDPTTNTWRGLPTRSRHVSQFMVGLEKTKAKSGEVAYLLAWLMLLRIDEIVKLRFENVDKIPGERRYIDVGLNTRKQNQTGLLHSWRLHANDDDPKVCPVWAFILLASLYGPEIRKSGPIFLHVSASGAVMQSQPLTASVLSRSLSRDLQRLGYASWALYGTHSFRRGGCQYRIKVKKWSADMVAAWGGWSQVEAVTMFRYFYSPNDNHEYMQDYDKNY
ncbi:hypothetical protein C8F04DRAFT_1271362 [Mycena alexandri]|uniref:Tyr recombinase domain-containing protein n=1 Tax=Mycena alexandri TaxID=1745969 RepID=A0AAD6SAL3_9AGAR|nr:hypothetical protein C8F04DRAFT_1271362 [Mycena alexandri]